MTVVGVPAVLILTVKLSLSFADQSGAQRVAPWPPRDGARRTETRRSALFRTFRRLLPGFLVISGTLVANHTTGLCCIPTRETKGASAAPA